MRHRAVTLMAALCVVWLTTGAATLVYGQGGGTTATLNGLVVDTSGGVVPGADILAKNNATAGEFRTVSDGTGRFSIPALQPGTYTVTVSLMGFKTVVLPDVQVTAATPANVRAVLEVGALEETVVVTGATEIVQTQTATVQTTIVVQQIQQLPLVTRTALDYVVNLPGVMTPGSNSRSSTIGGLPNATINITLDGINVQDNRGSGDRFFMYIRPLMDSVEEVTVSTSTAGADSTGAGATQIRMVTRSGSNKFAGSVYNTWRNQAGVSSDDAIARSKKRKWIWRLNTPYWFNKRDLPKTAAGEYFIDDMRLQTPGFRVGGPILKDKLFYFFNQEWFRWPNQLQRTRYLMNETARQGIFTYPALDGTTRTVNLYAIAAANSQVATPDPTIGKLLADIRQAALTEGAIDYYDQNVDRYTYSPSGMQARYFPTVRIDYNVTSAQRLTFTGRYNSFKSYPDILNGAEARFPGFPNYGAQVSGRYMWGVTLRSTFGKNLVNEFRTGAQDATGKGTYFGKGVNEGMFNCTGLGCQSVGGKGWNLDISAFRGITTATAYGSSSAGVANLFSVEDTVTYLKGQHSLSMGATFTRMKMRNWSMTPYYASLGFGLTSLDSVAYYMLDATSGNYPGGISTTWAGYARSLYAVLTGRVTSISGTAYLGPDGKYHFNGERTNATTADDIGAFISDSWRWKPNLTINAGLRYEVQLPMTTDGLYSRPETWQMVYGITGAGSGLFGSGNLFQPGLMTGSNDIRVVPYEKNKPAYHTDWNNLAPSVGAAWRPNIKSEFWSKILSKDPVFRGGYSISFTRPGTNWFDSNYSGNPGRSRAASRGTSSGTPYIGSDIPGVPTGPTNPQVFPVLLQQVNRLFPSYFPEEPVYPITPAVNEMIDIHYPDVPTSYTHSWSAGYQRELGRSTAFEIRYMGNIWVGDWTSWNMNSTANWNILENGFYDEFRKAQANLRANIIAGKGTTFAYTGAPGTSPLPIFLAHFNGIPLNDPRNQDPAYYTNANFKSSSWYNSLNMYGPSITGIAGTGTSGLQNTAYLANAEAAGLPANFWMANPALRQGSAYLETRGGSTRYHGLEMELRRRMSAGLLFQVSYTGMLSRDTYAWNSLRENWYYVPSTAYPKHALKFNWIYELPFGRGKRWGSGASRLVDAIIGGWEFDGVGRIQTGPRFNYGGYRLVGMTEKDLQKMFKFYKRADSTGKVHIYMFPQDVIENSILALYTTSATTATGYAGALPTGRYLAPASGPDCASFIVKRNYIRCPGTTQSRIIQGPMYWKVDLSFVKRITVVRNMRIEARMDLYNVFDTINFTPTSGMGSTESGWRVTSAARDANASQDPGGRITSFGLRFTW